MGRGRLLLCAVGVAALGYLCYLPVPPDIDDRWLVRLAGPIVFASMRRIGKTMEFLGMGTSHDIFRKAYDTQGAAMAAREDPALKITNTVFDGVQVRIFEPVRKPTNHAPGMVFFHGGGWVIGSVDSHDAVTRILAKDLSMVVVSVSYRLAPEHPFPAAFNDCVVATKYFMKNSAEFGVDPSRIAVAGDSAGGNLAAAVSLKLRDDNEFDLKLQVLIYPCLQAFDLLTPSYQMSGKKPNGIFLTDDFMAEFWLKYALGANYSSEMIDIALKNEHISKELRESKYAELVNRDLIDRKYFPKNYVKPKPVDSSIRGISDTLNEVIINKYYAPLMEDDLSGLPDVYMLTVEYDILRDDGLLYARRLEDAGVMVTHKHYSNGWHGVFSMVDQGFSLTDVTIKGIVEFLSKNL